MASGTAMTAMRGRLIRVWGARVLLCLVLAGAALAVAIYRPGPFAADPASTIARREPAFVASFSKPSPPAMPPVDWGSAALYQHFTEQGYTLESVREARADVPRLYAARLPRDLPELDSIDTRKQVFVKMLLPLILAENEHILAERERVERLREQADSGLPLPPSDSAWLDAVAERYGVARHSRNFYVELLRRADIVPPSLALGQAALETGWGTSPVAQTGHAMFGQMESTGDAVRRFNHLAHAIEAYALNLNTHRAYAQFRAKRAEMRSKGQVPDGYDLALTLTRYSERKMDYVRDVRVIIRTNRFRPLDRARLDG